MMGDGVANYPTSKDSSTTTLPPRSTYVNRLNDALMPHDQLDNNIMAIIQAIEDHIGYTPGPALPPGNKYALISNSPGEADWDAQSLHNVPIPANAPQPNSVLWSGDGIGDSWNSSPVLTSLSTTGALTVGQTLNVSSGGANITGALALTGTLTASGQATFNGGLTGNGTTSLSPALPVSSGGTALATLTAHALYVGNGVSAPNALAIGTTGQVLIGATGADPGWGALGVNSGLTAHGVLVGENNSAIVALGAGTTGQVLIGATGADPAFGAVGVNSGLTAHGVLLAQGNGAFTATAVGSATQVLTSNGPGNDPTFQAASGGGGVTGFATPAVSLGTAAAAGAATTVIRSDSTIVAFDATAPVTQAFGDAAAVGAATVAARRDHKHGMPANPVSLGTVTAVSANDAAANGSSGNVSRSDHNHGLPANVTPVTQAFSDAAAIGTSTSVARADHRHGMPASPGSTNAFKELGAGTATSNQTVTATSTPGTDITGLSVTCTPDGTHPVYVEVDLPEVAISSTVPVVLAIQKDGSVVSQTVSSSLAAGEALVMHIRYRDSAPTNASHIYKASIWSSGAQTLTLTQSSVQIALITVTQVQT